MIRVQLLDRDRDALDAEFRQTADRKLRDRLQIVLMADRGRRPAMRTISGSAPGPYPGG